MKKNLNNKIVYTHTHTHKILKDLIYQSINLFIKSFIIFFNI